MYVCDVMDLVLVHKQMEISAELVVNCVNGSYVS